MSEKFRTFAGCMRNLIVHIVSHAHRLVCMLVLVCSLASCGWQEAKEVIVLADSIDQNCHVIYDDTAALGGVIRSLDNPFGRVLMPNTLGKAYYYMGRNLEDSYCQIPEAAQCYIEADRLQIDDPIYRGRVNSCMGYICGQNNCDSTALIFYERASEMFKQSGNEWYYAHCVLNIAQYCIYTNAFTRADSLLQFAKLCELDSAYRARYYEMRGLYFYRQLQYDSALVYYKELINYPLHGETKCAMYLRLVSTYSSMEHFYSAIPYAQYIIDNSANPNYLSNAYYCMMRVAKDTRDVQLLSKYAHDREDANRILEAKMSVWNTAVTILQDYLRNPYPSRKIHIIMICIISLCLLSLISAFIYRKFNTLAHAQIEILSQHVQMQQDDIQENQELLKFENNKASVISKYHSPHKRWRNYTTLKRDIAPWFDYLNSQLDTLPLSNQEKIFCVISLIYPHMTDVEIADFICYGKDGIRVFKNRILKKLNIVSADFPDFLRELSTPK